MAKRFSDAEIHSARNQDLETVLRFLGQYVTQDKTYVPKKNENSKLFVAEINGRRFSNLLITGERWFDLDAKKGGGGAIDLTMYVMKVCFVKAVKSLSAIENQDTEQSDSEDDFYSR